MWHLWGRQIIVIQLARNDIYDLIVLLDHFEIEKGSYQVAKTMFIRLTHHGAYKPALLVCAPAWQGVFRESDWALV